MADRHTRGCFKWQDATSLYSECICEFTFNARPAQTAPSASSANSTLYMPQGQPAPSGPYPGNSHYSPYQPPAHSGSLSGMTTSGSSRLSDLPSAQADFSISLDQQLQDQLDQEALRKAKDQTGMDEEYEIDDTLYPAKSQPGGLQIPDDRKIETGAEFPTAKPATPAVKASENCCLDPPQEWRSFSHGSNKRLLWAKEQVLNRVPNYIKLYNIETKSGSEWLSSEMVAQAFSQIQTHQGSRAQPQLLLLQGGTYIITRTLKKVVPGVFTVLNMASEARHGDQLFNNSLQQKQSLCMQGNLFQRLQKLNGGKYPLKPGELIITEDSVVCFSHGHHALPPSQIFYTHVISMRAPICPRDTIADGYATSRAGIQMRKNIKTLIDAADVLLTNVLVLSAWGCGVYHNPTAEVARMFRAELSSRDWAQSVITHVIFAISDEKDGKPIWRPFMDVFHDDVPGFGATVIDRFGSFTVKLWLDQVSTLT